MGQEEELRARILAETLRFRAALSRLSELHRGKWVVFRDGVVHSVHETEQDAYKAGVARFGQRGGHVVAQVVEEAPLPVSASSLFDVR
jgi:hypothetical protein